MFSEIEKAYDYCRRITRLHAKSFYFAAKFLPARKQKPIYALYALCRRVDDEVDEAEISDERAAVAAVERWKNELHKVYADTPDLQDSGFQISDFRFQISNSELVLIAWKDLLKTYKIPQHLPLELMRGVLMDTRVKRYETFDELYVYCYRVASTVGLMSSEIFGYEKPETLEFAEALGIAMQMTNILRDVKDDALMGRIYLPQEDLRKFGVTERQIFDNQTDESFIRLMKFEIARARRFYQKAEQGISLLEKDTRFTVLLAARLYAKILEKIERQNYDVFAARAHTTKLQKILAIPRIRREAKKL
ncbi:MAG: phytoene/squalene synthase family protein [Pyrinomonadaceae bacterium]